LQVLTLMEVFMKQIIFKSGNAVCVEVPVPQLQSKQLLVDVRASCISPGTEMTGLSASGKSIWQKAKENPEKVKAAFDRMKTGGVFSVLHKAQAKQENEGISGYSAAGVIKDIGAEVSGYSRGMRVAIAGAGYANHSEQAVVPINLTVPIPQNVSFEEASTCALGGIALQGIRRANVSLGDIVVVSGCGPIGLLTIQMLRANGCLVIGIDLDANRLALANKLGAEFTFNPTKEDIVSKVMHASNGQGADRVILTLATTSAEPLQQAFSMSRRKGKIILVGVVGMELKRDDFYKKELDFLISTSYGPGRYDEQYEQKGIDYPYGYVRWTEQRNMEAYLHMISDGSVKLDQIINSAFPIEKAEEAYQFLSSPNKPLLVLLSYLPSTTKIQTPLDSNQNSSWVYPKDGILKVALVGTGAFVQGMHIPNLLAITSKYSVEALLDLNSISARKAARSFSNSNIQVETDFDKILNADIDMVLIGTRHNSHANLAERALKAGKAVFVEKPMAISQKEFKQLTDTISKTNAPFMVGYNRRFSPAVQKIKENTDKRVNPLIIQYTMNAGYIPYDAWVHTEEGGGRIIGEACHIIDLFSSLTNADVVSVSCDGITPTTKSIQSSDNAVITLKYDDGSVCSLVYTGLGSKDAQKERMQVFCDEQLFVLDDYIKLSSFGTNCNWSSKLVDKGHIAELEYFADQIKQGKRFPIPIDNLKETWLITRQIADMLTQ